MTDETKNWLATELGRAGVNVALVWHLIHAATREDEEKLAIALQYLNLMTKPVTGKADRRQQAKRGLQKIAAVPSVMTSKALEAL